MDDDLEHMTRDELVAEVKAFCRGIRQHRDENRQDLCWHHPDLLATIARKDRSAAGRTGMA